MIGAIIQARMGSLRLPGKVLRKVNGKTLLFYLIERLRASRLLDTIIVATSRQSNNDAIEEECRLIKVPCYRGSEQDVLDRFYNAALKHKIGIIVRITGDCPMVMPGLVDRACRYYLKNKPDYLGHVLPYPEGLADMSIVSFDALKTAWLEARKPSEREHVVTFLFNNPERFKVVRIKVNSRLNNYRFTVDEEKDYRVVKHIINELYNKPKKIFGFQEIEKYVKAHPDIMRINMHIQRNEGYKKALEADRVWEKSLPVRTKMSKTYDYLAKQWQTEK